MMCRDDDYYHVNTAAMIAPMLAASVALAQLQAQTLANQCKRSETAAVTMGFDIPSLTDYQKSLLDGFGSFYLDDKETFARLRKQDEGTDSAERTVSEQLSTLSLMSSLSLAFMATLPIIPSYAQRATKKESPFSRFGFFAPRPSERTERNDECVIEMEESRSLSLRLGI
jgi:hypothetical protein